MAVKERRAQAAQNPRHLPMWVQTTLRVFEGPAAKLGLVLLIIMLILCLGAPLFTQSIPGAFTPQASPWAAWPAVS